MNTGTLAIASATELHRIFSSGVEHLNHQGHLPLHLASTSNGVQSADMVVFLLRLFPGASGVRDREDFYPLHLAAMNESGYAEAMVNELLRPGLNMECCSMEDRQGMLPVHLACRNHGCSAGAMFHEMMRVHPEAVRHLDRSDMLPLHHACGNRQSQVWKWLLSAWLPTHKAHCLRIDKECSLYTTQ